MTIFSHTNIFRALQFCTTNAHFFAYTEQISKSASFIIDRVPGIFFFPRDFRAFSPFRVGNLFVLYLKWIPASQTKWDPIISIHHITLNFERTQRKVCQSVELCKLGGVLTNVGFVAPCRGQRGTQKPKKPQKGTT